MAMGTAQAHATWRCIIPLFDLCSTVFLLYLWGTSRPSRERS